MKKSILWILVCSMLITCFAGCSKSEESSQAAEASFPAETSAPETAAAETTEAPTLPIVTVPDIEETETTEE